MPPPPVAEGPDAAALPVFSGRPATPHPVAVPDAPRLLLEPRALETVAILPLPPRIPGGGSVFTDFAGGGYFFLDHRDCAVIPTTTRHVYVIGQTGGGTGFAIERDYDLTTAVLPGDKIISALPDWTGRLWFASTGGVVGTVDPASGAVRSVENTGAVYMVTDKAAYRGKRRVARDRRRPFQRVVRIGRGPVRMQARIVLKDGRRVVRTRKVGRARTLSSMRSWPFPGPPAPLTPPRAAPEPPGTAAPPGR